MYGLGVNKLGAGKESNPVAKLFANGEEGAWYDISDLATLFQEDGTTPAVVGQEVGKVLDKSGNGNHLVQTTATNCPILQVENGRYYLDFDGGDGLQASAIDMTGTNQMTVCAGCKKDTNDTMAIAEFSLNVGGNQGTFRIASLSNVWRWTSRGNNTVNVNSTGTTYGAGSLSVLTGQASITGDTSSLRIDGALNNSSTADQGDGPYGNHTLNVGARNAGASIQLDGRIYGLVVRGASSTASEVDALEEYMGRKTGVAV